MLSESPSLLESWPATMIIHGDLDGIVPVEHSYHFLDSLVLDSAELSGSDSGKNKNNGRNSADSSHHSNEKHENCDEKANDAIANGMAIKGNIGGIIAASSAVYSSVACDEPSAISGSSSDSKGGIKSTVIKVSSSVTCATSSSSGRLITGSPRKPATHNASNSPNYPDKGPNSPDWRIRAQDVLVTIPGAKHSFEAVGGETLDVVCEGVINWLSRI